MRTSTMTTAARRASPLVIIGLCLLLAGCEDEAETKEKARLVALDEWVSSVGTVAQICHDGRLVMFADGKRWVALRRGAFYREWRTVTENFTC